MVVEIDDKVTIDSEGYCGKAYIRQWAVRGAMVSVDRFGKTWFVPTRAIKELREG